MLRTEGLTVKSFVEEVTSANLLEGDSLALDYG